MVAEEPTAAASVKVVMLCTEAAAEVFDLAVTHFMEVAVEAVPMVEAEVELIPMEQD